MGFPWGFQDETLNNLCIAASGNVFEPKTMGAYITFISGNAYKMVAGKKASIKQDLDAFTTAQLSNTGIKISETLSTVETIAPINPPPATGEGDTVGAGVEDLNLNSPF
jgi:hypothetical protein